MYVLKLATSTETKTKFSRKVRKKMLTWQLFIMKHFFSHACSSLIIKKYHLKDEFDVLLRQQNTMKNFISGYTTTEVYVVLDIFDCSLSLIKNHFFWKIFIVLFPISINFFYIHRNHIIYNKIFDDSM